MKNIKGYISSNLINNNLISQKIQNLVIRKYCDDKNLMYTLSNAEYIHDESFIGLNEIIDSIDKYYGIVAYSIHQLPKDNSLRLKLLKKVLKKKKFIAFATEDISVADNDTLNYLELLLNLNNYIKKN